MTKKIIYNAIQTPDGTVLESLHRHDYKTYTDTITRKVYMIDGGTDYIRHSINGDEVFLTIYSDAPFEILRKYLYRLGYGKPGGVDYGEYRKTLFCEMSDEHLQASLDYKRVVKGGIHWQYLLEEKLYRAENNITISDND